MVARGDLGAEVPLEELPYMQKKMVEASIRKGKYCIVATQVLDSMIKNPRPTRAEVTDTANAILDGSAAISMSGETAYGDYPLEATETMGRIMKYTEDKRSEMVHFTEKPAVKSKEYTEAARVIAEADKAGATSIVVSCSDNIEFVRALSAYRPSQTIIAMGQSEENARELMLAYAVRPMIVADMKKEVIIEALENHAVHEADTITWVDAVSPEFTTKSGTLQTFR
jgi:pyruvate kinase